MSLNLREEDGSVLIPLRVSPGASNDSISGEHDGAIKLNVTAVPEKGKANKAVVKLVAKVFKLRKSDLEIVKGETSQDKVLKVDGLSEVDFVKLWKDYLEK